MVAVHLCAGATLTLKGANAEGAYAILRRKALRCSSCFSPCRRRYPYDTHSARVSRLRGQTIRDLLTEPSSSCAAQLAMLTRKHGSRCLFKPRRQGIPSLNPERKRPHRPSTAPAEPTSHFQEQALPCRRYSPHLARKRLSDSQNRASATVPWNGQTPCLAVRTDCRDAPAGSRRVTYYNDLRSLRWANHFVHLNEHRAVKPCTQ